MAPPTRIALIGCGFYAANHLNAWRDLAAEGAELAGVCDLDASKAEAAGRRFNTPWFADAAEMIEATRPDLVDIVTQMRAHRALLELALRRGAGCIVQKPLAPSWEDCLAMATFASSSGRFAAVHENFRFQTPMLRVKKLIDAGAIGAVRFARISFRTGFDVYRTQPYFLTEPKLVILDVGVHLLDLARVFAGEVERVSCETQTRKKGIRGEDTATMLLRHRSGGVSVVDCTFEAKRQPDSFPETLLEIEGERGSLIMKPGCRLAVASDGLSWEEDAAAPLLPWTERPWHVSQEGVLNACRHLLTRFREGRPADTSIEDNLKTMALAEAAYQAAISGSAIAPRA